MQMLDRRAAAAALAAVVAIGGFAASAYAGYRVWRHLHAAAPATPVTAVVLTAPTPGHPVTTDTPSPPLPASVFIKVPYTAQSPFNQWGAGNPHEEYCEAAALLMVGSYFKGDTRDRLPPAEADSAMAQIVSVERRTFPGVLDLPLTSVAAVGTQLYGLRPAVAAVDLGQIERSVAEGRPVVVPVMTHGAGGQRIAPFYGAVDVYHVIVITGYDSGRGLLYTNDAGFVQGQNYAYGWTTLSTAIDAQAQKFPQGRVMLVFSRT
jgi:hypothetical protein